jgi:hypothetical protein
MFVRFKCNWRWAEQGIFVRDFSEGSKYRYSDKCSEDEILPEAAELAKDLGVAEEVKQKSTNELQVPEQTADISEKKTSSGRSKKTGKKKRSSASRAGRH